MTEEDKLFLAQPLTDIYVAMETDLMKAIAEQLAYDGGISPSSEWRLRKLAEAGALTKTAIKIISSYTGIQSDMLSEAVEIAALDVINELEPAFAKMAADGLVSAAPEVPASVTAKSIVSHYRRQAATDLNLVNTVMQYKAVSSYKYLVNKMYDETKRQEALNNMGKHTLSVVTGAESRQQAVRNCIREFSRNGIPAFVDKAGREWSPEAYVNMDIRTTVSNTAHAAQDAVCDRYDVDLIEISSHMGARPKCAPYQGKVFSRKGQSGVAYDGKGDAVPYSPLSETSYGQPDGIFGINCRHKKYPFVSGASFRTYFPYDEEENAERYKAFQKQRYMERRVREASREAEMLKIAGDEQGAKDARLKAKNRRAEYRKYCSDNGLKERNDRLTVVKARQGQGAGSASVGTVPAGGGLSNKTVRETPKNVLTNSNQNAIINAGATDSFNRKSRLYEFDEDLKSTNPNFETGEYRWTNNCQRCAPAYEMRRRGFNVTALPLPCDNVRNDYIAKNHFVAWKNPKPIAFSSQNDIEAKMLEWGDGTRAQIIIAFKNEDVGHTFIAEQIDGKTLFIDPQTGSADCSCYFEKIAQYGNFFARIDNLAVNDDIITECCK